MFLKRLSIAGCALMCFGSIVLGTNANTTPTALTDGERNEVMAPLAVIPLLTTTPPRCAGESNGKISVTIETGTGTAPYTFQIQKTGQTAQTPISNQPATYTFENLDAGEYTVFVTDADGGLGSAKRTLTDLPVLSVNLEQVLTQPQCTGETVDVFFEAEGGLNTSYTYRLYEDLTLFGSNNNGDFSGLGEGTYSLTVVDANGCSSNYKGSLDITEPAELNPTVSPVQIACYGESGSAVISGLPQNTGVDAFNMTLENTSTGNTSYSLNSSNSYIGLDAGDYELTVWRDGCTAVKRNFTIDPVLEMDIQENLVGSIDCFGETVEITVAVNGGKAGKNMIIALDNNDGDPNNDQLSPPVVYGTSHTFTLVGEGNYTITARDAEVPSCARTKNINVPGPASPLVYTAAPEGGSTSCFGTADGTVQIPVSGGQQPYKFYVGTTLYNSVAEIQLAAGSYTVYVEDDNGCRTDDAQIVITQPDELSATIVPGSIENVSCPSGNDGAVSISITGGNGGYTYDLSGELERNGRNATGTTEIADLIAGDYTVLVKDKNACTASPVSFSMSEPVEISINDFEFSSANLCYGETTNLSVSASGGSQSTMTYTLYKGSTELETQTGSSANFIDLSASVYTLKIWSDLTCASKDTTFTISSSKQIIVSSYNDSIMINCSGELAQLPLTVQGASPFSYQLDNGTVLPFTGGTTTVVDGLSGSQNGETHVITIIDINGCSKAIDVEVFEPEGLTINNLSSTDETCKARNNGTLSFTINGGTPGYEVMLGSLTQSSSNGNIVFNNVPAGTYSITVTDDAGCILTNPDDVEIKEPAEDFTIDEPVVLQPIACNGDLAEVSITVSGGWPNTDKHINVKGQGVDLNGLAGSSFNLPGGSYTITATSDDGCSAVRYFDVAQPELLVLSIENQKNVSCFGADDAEITIAVSGGVGPYSYGLEGSGTASVDFAGNQVTIADGLESRSYELVVRDANGCESNIENVKIEEPTPVEFTFSDVDSVVCYDQSNGRIEVLATGGSGSYLYALSGDANRAEQTSREFRNLAAGEYFVNVRDSKGCAALVNNQDTIIFQPQQIVIDEAVVSSAISCAGESDAVISISANGGEPYTGLQYKVSNTAYQNEPDIEGLDNGNYQVFVRDSRGKCETVWTETITIADPAELVLLPAEVTNVSCYNSEDGSVKIQADGGTGARQFYLYKGEALIEGPKNVGEFNGLGELSNTPNMDVTVNYTIEVMDENNCSASVNFSVVNPAAIRIEKVAHRQVSCYNMGDGWITVNVRGGTGSYSFKQDDDDAAITPDFSVESTTNFKLTKLSGGMYSPVVIDERGCSDTIAVPVRIINPPKLVISSVDADGKNCNYSTDDSTIIHLDENLYGTPGNYQYSIDGGTSYQNSELFINVRSHTINPVVKDSMGCVAAFEEIEIEWPDAFVATLTKNEIRCWDRQYGTLSVEYDGGTAPYYLSVEDRLFAEAFVSQADESRPTTRDTIGDKSEYLFVYDNTYEIYVKDHKGCYAENLNVSKTSDPVASYSWLPADTLWLKSIDPTRPKCNGDQGTIQYTVDGGTQPYKYWVQSMEGVGNVVPANQDDDGLVNVPTGMNLYAYVSDYYNCKAKVPGQDVDFLTTYIYPIHDTVKVEVDVVKDPYCPSTKDGRVMLEVTGYLKDGVRYHIYKHDTIYNKYSEVFFDQIFRDEATDSAQVSLPPESDLVNVKEWTYSVNHDTVSYKFTAGLYEIHFIDNITECDVSYQFELIADTSECDDVFPKIFTPNNDGQNDLWTVSQYEKSNVNLKIFTAYGELVYEFSGLVPEEGLTWDGLDLDHRPVPAGTYMYIYNADVTLEKEHLEYGTVTILRHR
ncbi:T9SS type B sorting domain-containing protein [Roseimarinus sediminis]|uniref:T9SS type B sorting domain-containing protein n=1 Tax=Roseimarinus sediminis TaxID=1610899 RepID=UPI003D1F29B4